MPKISPTKIFPNIDLETLAEHADDWQDWYPFIKKITLYKPRLVFKNLGKESAKYIVIFEINEDKIDKNSDDYLSLTGFKQLNKDIAYGVLDVFINEHFASEVYKDPNDLNWKSEWHFIILQKDEDWSEYVKKKSEYVLFPISSDRNKLNINSQVDQYLTEKTASNKKPKTKLRPNQRHKIEVIKVAQKLWEKDPDRTIADIVKNSTEIVAACDGKLYVEKTIRNWINEFCPNRDPGRRPKKV